MRYVRTAWKSAPALRVRSLLSLACPRIRVSGHGILVQPVKRCYDHSLDLETPGVGLVAVLNALNPVLHALGNWTSLLVSLETAVDH